MYFNVILTEIMGMFFGCDSNVEGDDMVQRLSISIPDSLHNRIQKFKENLNFSKICQDALTGAVEMEEMKNTDIPERDKMIAKLRKQKEELTESYRQEGIKAGIENARSGDMDYSDFVAIEEAGNALGAYEYPQQALDEAVFDDWLREPIDDAEKDDRTFSRDAYIRGWVEGVMEVWNEVKDEI